MELEYEVVLFMLQKPDVKLVVARRTNKAECRRLMRVIAGTGWTMERRNDLHTFGELVLTLERRER